jgi:PAS domain S-box-containing protein
MALPEGHYEYVSAASEDVFGYEPEAFLEHPRLIRRLLHPGWRGYFDDQWERLLAGEMPPTYEYAVIHHQTGETRWLHQRNVLIRDADGRPVAMEGIVTDVTARTLAEIDLRHREAALESILSAAPLGIGLLSDGIFLEVNPRLCEITGYDAQELLGEHVSTLYADPSYYERTARTMLEKLLTQAGGTLRSVWRRRDGTEAAVLISAAPLDTAELSAGITVAALELDALR